MKTKKAPFKFYRNTIALSFEKPNGKGELQCDFMMEGSPNQIANALIEQMERHPEFAELITTTAYNFWEMHEKSINNPT